MVRDDDASFSFHQPRQRFDDGLFRGRIKTSGGFIENQNRSVADDCPGNRYTLSLSTRERNAAFADHGAVTLRQLLDKIMRIRLFGCTYDLVPCGIWPAVCNVFPDGGVEEQRFLQNEAYLLSNGFQFVATDVFAINFNRARLRIVYPRDETDDCGLSS